MEGLSVHVDKGIDWQGFRQGQNYIILVGVDRYRGLDEQAVDKRTMKTSRGPDRERNKQAEGGLDW